MENYEEGISGVKTVLIRLPRLLGCILETGQGDHQGNVGQEDSL